MLNRGFAAMIPAEPEEPKQEQEDVRFKHAIEFSVLNYHFSFNLNVKKRNES